MKSDTINCGRPLEVCDLQGRVSWYHCVIPKKKSISLGLLNQKRYITRNRFIHSRKNRLPEQFVFLRISVQFCISKRVAWSYSFKWYFIKIGSTIDTISTELHSKLFSTWTILSISVRVRLVKRCPKYASYRKEPLGYSYRQLCDPGVMVWNDVKPIVCEKQFN